jgi:hypothetical protein
VFAHQCGLLWIGKTGQFGASCRNRRTGASGASRLHAGEPLRRGDQRDGFGAGGEVGLRAAHGFAADRSAGEQRTAADLALGRFVDAQARIIKAVADLACLGKAGEAVHRRAEREIAGPGGRRRVAHEVDEFRRE